MKRRSSSRYRRVTLIVLIHTALSLALIGDLVFVIIFHVRVSDIEVLVRDIRGITIHLFVGLDFFDTVFQFKDAISCPINASLMGFIKFLPFLSLFKRNMDLYGELDAHGAFQDDVELMTHISMIKHLYITRKSFKK